MLTLAACGGGGTELSELAQQGREIAQERGCTACHGEKGEGTVGPAWLGLLDSTVQLEDGSAVVADTDYIRRSITEPDSQIVAGYTISMPITDLSDSEVAAVVAYIEELK